MLSFSHYIVERNLSGAPGTEGKGRGISHIIHYLGPYMSAEDREETIKRFDGRISRADLSDNDGEKYHPTNTSHQLGSNHETFAAGENIKIQHAFLDPKTNKMMVATRDHGIIPASKIQIPEEVRRAKKTEEGMKNEVVISNNFGVMPAGAARNAYDFYWNGPGQGKENKILGKARHNTDSTPLIKGESKRNSGARMGVAKLVMNKDTGEWGFHPKSDPKIVKSMMKAKVAGKDGVERNIVDHYNHHYRGQGVTPAGGASAEGTGVTRAYLGRYNALHLHRTERGVDHGTSYTMFDAPNAGKTNVAHLSDKDIKKLEGKFNFEKSAGASQKYGGSVRITHSPNVQKFNELAGRSVTDPEHNASFMNPEHVAEYKRRFVAANGINQTQTSNSNKPKHYQAYKDNKIGGFQDSST